MLAAPQNVLHSLVATCSSCHLIAGCLTGMRYRVSPHITDISPSLRGCATNIFRLNSRYSPRNLDFSLSSVPYLSQLAMPLGLSIGSAFDAAIERYITDLPPSLGQKIDINALKTTTATELLKELEILQKNPKMVRMNNIGKRMDPFLQQLLRFQQVVDICIQARPEVACLVWGGLKLLIQVWVYPRTRRGQ